MGLVPALRQLCEDLGEQYGVLFTVNEDNWPRGLTSELRMILFRCVRELLINSAKHAEANEVKVHLTSDNDRMLIIVEDDGIGFDASESGRGFSVSGGFGLFNMNEYLKHMGGTLRIDSSSGRSTRVFVEVPLQYNDPMNPPQETGNYDD